MLTIYTAHRDATIIRIVPALVVLARNFALHASRLTKEKVPFSSSGNTSSLSSRNRSCLATVEIVYIGQEFGRGRLDGNEYYTFGITTDVITSFRSFLLHPSKYNDAEGDWWIFVGRLGRSLADEGPVVDSKQINCV